MQVSQYATNNAPCKLVARLNAKPGTVVFICGFDPASKNTEYFWRQMDTRNFSEYEFRMPLSPDTLKVVAFTVDNAPFDLQFSAIMPLDVKPLPSKIEESFFGFASLFCKKAGTLPCKTYTDQHKQFVIQVAPALYEGGMEIPTPARIHTKTNEIQVCKPLFDRLTVPGRVIIILHEFAHNYLNSDIDNEEEADARASEIYIAKGFPRVESIATFASVFTGNKQSYGRMLQLHGIMSN